MEREGIMRVVSASIEIDTPGDAHVEKITAQVAAAIAESGIGDGIVTVFAPGATGAITTLEFEPGVVQDWQAFLDAIVPPGARYQHSINLRDDNGHSHIRAGLIGPSLTVPVSGGAMSLGRWQEIVFCDFDSRPRERSLVVQVMGI
jgi:secondary thiamine-phosphate synthase enzyme